MAEHLITPPPELVEQWRDAPEYATGLEKLTMVSLTTAKLQDIATAAAQWGADMELEACVEWMGDSPVIWRGDPEEHPGFYLREARRPKPPSLKEQALEQLKGIEACFLASHGGNLVTDTIRRALETLDD
jgi:hypothetical protein